MSTISFYDALSAVEEVAGKGIGVYDLAVAFELGYAITLKKKAFGRRKKLIKKLDDDAPRLFDAAMDAFRKSAGACSPLDAANGIIDAYLKCGMDVGRAMAYASISDFAIGS